MKKAGACRRHPSRREVLKYGIYGGVAAGLAPYLWVGGCGKGAGRKKPNIIMITVDTLRADHLGCYGYAKNTSPYIDRFAQDAMLFELCFSHAPVTGSSFASMMSGFLPHETQVYENFPLPAEVDTIASILQGRGYQTAAVISNYMLRRGTGWERGFTIFDDELKSKEINRNLFESVAGDTTDRSIKILDQLGDEPLFMWVHYQDPHGPYTPPDNLEAQFRDVREWPKPLWMNKSVSGFGGIPSYQQLGLNTDFYHYVAQYDGEIRYLDGELERLLGHLKKRNRYEDSLIIFTADHGEGMGENNYYFAHGETLHRSLLHVPLMLKYGKELTGRRSDMVQHIDLAPTILEFLNMEAERLYRGSDLRTVYPGAREIFAEMNSAVTKEGLTSCLIAKDYKLIHAENKNQYRLFDTVADPQEERNLFDKAAQRHRSQDLQARLHRIQEQNLMGVEIVNEMPELSDEDMEILRSLGYLR